MKTTRATTAFLLVTAAMSLGPATRAERTSLRDELAELKVICDEGLLEEDECAERRRAILDRHDDNGITWFCNYGGETVAPRAFPASDSRAFSESASASSIVREILDEAGLAPNFVVRPAQVPNAAASARNGERYIVYNPSFVAQLKNGTRTNWSVYSVMAHEIGHHLQGHTLQPGGSRPSIELEADEYSGFILARLGASLDDAQRAMRAIGSDAGSATHPGRRDRLEAIAEGWARGEGKGGGSTADDDDRGRESPPPPSQPTVTDTCVVNGESVLITDDGSILSPMRGNARIGRKTSPMHPNCAFDLVAQAGRFCVDFNGMVYFGTPMPVGQCRPCRGGRC